MARALERMRTSRGCDVITSCHSAFFAAASLYPKKKKKLAGCSIFRGRDNQEGICKLLFYFKPNSSRIVVHGSGGKPRIKMSSAVKEERSLYNNQVSTDTLASHNYNP